MPNLLKNILAFIVGIVAGSVVNMTIVSIGPTLIPPPNGVDMTDMDKLAENILKLKPANFLAPLLAHALGTLFGAFTAAKLARSYKLSLSLGVAAFFLMGGIAAILMIGGPFWFKMLDILGAYLPMGYLGGILGGARKNDSDKE